MGFGLGLANGLSTLSRNLTDTTLHMIRNVPHLALIPLVILWFGIDAEAKLFLVAPGYFPIHVNTLPGIQGVDPQLVEMGRTYGVNNRDLLTRVILPAIFTGLRYAIGILWLTLIVAETISATSGLGHAGARVPDDRGRRDVHRDLHPSGQTGRLCRPHDGTPRPWAAPRVPRVLT
jgi:sulfonate transport system permease protein